MFKKLFTRNSSTTNRLFGIDTIWNDGRIYMRRFWLWRFRIHIFYQADTARDPHDHPFWFVTFPLTSYVELETHHAGGECWITMRNTVKAFRFHYRPANHTHRVIGRLVSEDQYGNAIADPDKRVVTLVFRGAVKRKWGFWKKDVKGEVCFIPHNEYASRKDQACS